MKLNERRYVVANIIVFVHASSVWFKKASDAELTAWVGLAKVAGKMLDFNLALLLIPVTRSLMLWMNDFGEHSSFNFAKWIPLRHNIEFHKVCALVVLGCASVHVIAHYIDFVFVRNFTAHSFTLPAVNFTSYIKYTGTEKDS